MNGTHRAEGIWTSVGPDGEDADAPSRLSAVAPWLGRAMGLAWTDPESAPIGTGSARCRGLRHDEEAMVAERLRALGYLE